MSILKQVSIKQGSEGPRHDPYSYTEFTWKNNGKVIVLHHGLRSYCKVDGAGYGIFGNDKEQEQYANEIFEKETGLKVQDIYDALYEGEHLVCEKCGPSAETEERDGMPGETFTICKQCGNVVNSSLNEGAII